MDGGAGRPVGVEACDRSRRRPSARDGCRAATRRPPSNTSTSSAASAVARRCAIVIDVLPAGQPADRSPQLHVERGVDRRRRFVEHEEVGPGDPRPHQRHELTFPRRDAGAAFTHRGVDSVGERPHPVVQLQFDEGGLDLRVAGAGAPVANVVGHGAGEEETLLGDEGDPGPQAVAGDVRRSIPSMRITPRVRIEKPDQQLGERGLARSGGSPTTATRSPGATRWSDPRAPRARSGRRTRQSSNDTASAPPGKVPRLVGLGYLDRGIERLDDAPEAGSRALGEVEDLHQALDRGDEQIHQEQDRQAARRP